MSRREASELPRVGRASDAGVGVVLARAGLGGSKFLPGSERLA